MDASEIDQLAVDSRKDKASMAKLIGHFQTLLVSQIKNSSIPANHYPDTVQEVLILVVRCVEQYDPTIGPFENYVRSLTSQLLLNIRRKQIQIRKREFCVGASWEPSIHSTYEDTDSRMDVGMLLGKLPDDQQSIIADHFGLGGRSYSINQIAARKKISQAKVKQQLSEAIQTIRKSNV